jgi:nucleoside-triphosphatase THEP1
MPHKITINNTWLKASILGAIWAASEIILGSFLHNLHIPFKGSILTAIAFTILIAVSYKWNDRGLFWRSGLICALLKTMSPSAVIFGPMIAIFMEALLLDLSVRSLGRNFFGFLLGSSLAMSWILIQKIFNLVLFYGTSLVDIYSQLMKFAEKQLQFQSDLVWTPILVLLGLYLVFGITAVILGMITGKRLIKSNQLDSFNSSLNYSDFQTNKQNNFPHSIGWLIMDFLTLFGMLFLLNLSPVWIWAPLTIIIVSIWVIRYRRAMRQLSKPRFWIFFAAITMISAFIITAIQNNGSDWLSGLLIGIQMNFRAAVVITGFTVLGTELYNPKIRNYFAQGSFRHLPTALELAFDSLPSIINNLPDIKIIVKKPLAVISLLIEHSEKRFNELQKQHTKLAFLITGDIAAGKTTFCKELIHLLQSKNIPTGGILSERIIKDNVTIGYDLIDISTGNRMIFLRENEETSTSKIGRFEINIDTVELGRKILLSKNLAKNAIVIIDEVGFLELQGKGWAESIELLKELSGKVLILAVRNEFVKKVIEEFGLKYAIVLDVHKDEITTATSKITEYFNYHSRD